MRSWLDSLEKKSEKFEKSGIVVFRAHHQSAEVGKVGKSVKCRRCPKASRFPQISAAKSEIQTLEADLRGRPSVRMPLPEKASLWKTTFHERGVLVEGRLIDKGRLEGASLCE